MMNLPKKAAVGAATLVAVLGAGGTAWAVESTATHPAPASSVSSPAAGTVGPGRHHRHGGKWAGLLGRADHGTLEVRTKSGWETLDFDRGQVTASSPSSITLLRPDGTRVTEAITSATRYRGPGSGAVVGRSATVISLDGKALAVRQRPSDGRPAPGGPTAGSAVG
jgi:hypothetical protein